MKKFGFKDFIGGFKEMFKSPDNLKVTLTVVLVLFLVLFITMGGCASCGCQGIVRCNGCGSSEVTDAPSGGDDVQNDNESSLFVGMTPAAATISDEYKGIAATFFYPTELCTYTEDSNQFWANWVGRIAVAAEGKFSIQPDFEFIADHTNPDGSYCSTFDEVKQFYQDRYGSRPETFGELTAGDNNGFWYVFSGYTTVVFPVLDTNLELELYLIPADYDPNADDATAKAYALIQDEELLAILDTLQITTIETIPDASTYTFG